MSKNKVPSDAFGSTFSKNGETPKVRSNLGTVLLVEDDEHDVFLLRHGFTESGVPNPIQVVHNGLEAADYLEGEGKFANRSLYPMPSLLLLDLKMPRMDGFEVLGWLHTRPDLNSIAVVVLSSSERAIDIQMAHQLQA